MTKYCVVIGPTLYRAVQQIAVKEVNRLLPLLWTGCGYVTRASVGVLSFFQLNVKLKYDSHTRKLIEIGYNIIARTDHKGVITECLL